jgi:hypothetical protein
MLVFACMMRRELRARAFQTVIGAIRTACSSRPTNLKMEGSMKMMSWSRYHCLSWSFLQAARRHRAAKGHRIRRRRDVARDAEPAQASLPGVSEPFLTKPFLTKPFLTKCFQFVMRMFRT